MDLGLKGKVGMIAGASRGLGLAIAKALAAEGASVSMASRDPAAIDAAANKVRQETGVAALGVLASSCVTRTIVAPRLARSCEMRSSSSFELIGSRPAEGSSKN
ncbi:MAG: SDR family NAD(P)-dependent oxidoreductase, partial [Acidobacteriia bacterium]|nr:SDR family NAD(P)-dependent oxidoreductase [Terriglobia bacterium]